MTVAIIIGAAYLSLLIELVFLHVPSVASSRSIVAADPAVVSVHSSRYQSVFTLPLAARLLFFVAPVGVIYAVYALPIVALLAGGNPLGDNLYAPARVSELAGLGLIVAGRSLSLWSVLLLRNAGGESREAGKLFTGGPFRRIRNPGLLGMYLFVFGLWSITPSLAMLAGIVVDLVHMDFRVRMEEDFLGNSFGDEYRDYCNRTGRYLP